MIKYESADNAFNYNVSVDHLSVNKFQGIQSTQQFQDTLSSIATITNTNNKTYKAKLPVFYMIMVDYQVYKNTFINLGYNYTYLKLGDDANQKFDFHTFSLTARYDKLHWGVGVPVSITSYQTNVGISARWRYLVVGSANIFNLLVQDESSRIGANGYFILKIPILYKKDKTLSEN